MGLRFVVGGPGSGKTRWVLGRVAAILEEEGPDGPPIILLVPEQASYQTERGILEHGFGGTIRTQVLSFPRLALWVRSQLPGDSGLPVLTDAHREVLAASLVTRLRREHPEADLFQARRIESAVAAFLGEVKETCTNADALRQAADQAEADMPVLASKLRQLLLAAGAYDERVRDRFQDPERTLERLEEGMRTLQSLEGARVFVDGYYGFEPVEYRLLAALLARARDAAITLSIDPDRYQALARGEGISEHGRTHAGEETYSRLVALAADSGTRVEGAVVLHDTAEARFRSDATSCLARGFLRYDPADVWPGATPELRLVEAQTPREEARAAAEQLLLWAEQQGLAWSDMAIITRDVTTYRQPLLEVLDRLKIPCFIDAYEPLETHPIVQGVLAALDVVLGGWPQSAVIDFAKSGLCRVRSDGVAQLELFVSAYPRTPSTWKQSAAWDAPPHRSVFDDEGRDTVPSSMMERLDKTRRSVAEPLMALQDDLGETGDGVTLGHIAATVCRFIHGVMPAPVPEDEPILDQVGRLMQSLLDAGGDEVFPAETALDLLRETFGRLSLPRIPPHLDEVVIAQSDRSRVPTVRAAIVLGLAEGMTPRTVSNPTLLSDAERDALYERAGVELQPSTRRLFLRESFYALVSMTRASEWLTLVRPLGSLAGESLAPSPYWEEARRLFPDARPESAGDALDLAGVLDASEAAAALCRIAARPDGLVVVPDAVGQIGRLAFEDGGGAVEFERVVASAASRNESAVDPALLASFYSGRMRTSVSALESFARCPFQFLMRSVMRPDVPLSTNLTAADLGEIAHGLLQRVSQDLVAGGLGFAAVADDPLGAVERAYDQVRTRVENSGLLASRTAAIALEEIRRQTANVVAFLAAADQAVGLRPAMAEVGFGFEEEGAKAVSLAPVPLPGGEVEVVLRGRIDAVMELGTEQSRWALVVDFKLSGRKLDWSEAAAGMALQLPTYLLAMEGDAQADPPLAGAVYLGISDEPGKQRKFRGVVCGGADEGLRLSDAKLVSSSKNRDQGDVVTDDEFAALPGAAADLLGDMVQRFFTGEAAVRPARVGGTSPCGFCDYRRACRLDFSVNDATDIAKAKRGEAIDAWLGPRTFKGGGE